MARGPYMSCMEQGKNTVGMVVMGVVMAVALSACTMSTWRMRYLQKTSYSPDKGKYISLKSHIFSAKSMMTGIMRPEKFASVYGVSIFRTGPHVQGRTPVVLVHGHTHGPRPFRAIVESLDEERYEPWIVLYPSGQKLRWTVSMLRESLARESRKLGVDQVAVIGYSQGGIVTRKALGVQLDGVEMPRVPLYVGVAPAYGGITANLGIDKPSFAPPSWDDVLAGSAFLEELFDDPLPPETSMNIIYGLLDEDSDRIDGPDDGALGEASMARPEAVAEADSVTVVEGTGHGGIIEHPTTIHTIGELLDAHVGGTPTP